MPELTIVPTNPTTNGKPSSRKKKAKATTTRHPKHARNKAEPDKLYFIERVRRPDWTVSTINERGRTVWFLRFQITGLKPRRFGPFQTEQETLRCLNKLLDEMWETLNAPPELDQDSGYIYPDMVRCFVEDETGIGVPQGARRSAMNRKRRMLA